MIRVLHVVATLDPAGAERQLVHLCRRLDPRRFAPAVCCLTRGGPLQPLLAHANIPVHILHKRSRWDLAVLLRLARLIRRFRPHILHTWLPTANTLGRLAGVACGVPVLVASERAADAWKGPLRRFADRILQHQTRRIICNADAVRRFLINHARLDPRKLVVIRNGLDLAEFDAAARAGLDAPVPPAPPGPLVGAVARLEPQKGLAHLIDAFALLPPACDSAQLWIAGAGPERNPLTRRARAHGLAQRIHFLGLRRDIPALMHRFDFLVLPSLWEGLPNVALEAMAARRPVVATRVDGTPEAVADTGEQTGILVPPGDPPALARAIAALIHNPALRARLGRAGRRRVQNRFSMHRMVAQTQALYRASLEET